MASVKKCSNRRSSWWFALYLAVVSVVEGVHVLIKILSTVEEGKCMFLNEQRRLVCNSRRYKNMQYSTKFVKCFIKHRMKCC